MVKVGAGAGVIALAFAQAPSSEAREALSGQCGVDGKEVSYTINSDGSLSMAVTGNGKGRVARFRFYGGNSGSNYYWDAYQYRYGVTETNYGPQSNEIVRFGQQRNDPGDSYWSQYYSPDSHNSNLPGSAPVQSISGWFTSPGGNTEIWTKAIFDVPGQPDPSCWTNAIATK
ncbi:MAG: hypothetical protein SGJ13_16910 [Actinomycetota bacterium]|nr:hypothetical protein [Actinomycetota bacterium]